MWVVSERGEGRMDHEYAQVSRAGRGNWRVPSMGLVRGKRGKERMLGGRYMIVGVRVIIYFWTDIP